MAIADDLTVAQNGNIRYGGAAHGATGAGYYTVIQFHRWLQDLADDAVASGNDLLDITDSTPSERSTDNIITLLGSYNIDQTLAEHLYDGSIIQAGGDDIWDGIVVIAAKGMDLQIAQDGAIISNDFWNTIPFGDTFKGLNRDTNNGISHRFMVKVRTAGVDLDGRRLLGQTRDLGYTYSEFKINGSARGNNVMALTYATDLNNQTSSGTIATWTTIANTNSGYIGIDVDNNGASEYYYSRWNKDIYSINQFYERIKYITRTGTGETLYGLNGELFRGITHEVNLTTPRTGTFDAYEKVTWGTGATAGEGQMLAINSTTAGTKMWIQLLKGVSPSGSVVITGFTSSATATYSGTYTERSLSFPACGVSTGSSLIGAYGFALESTDLSSSDKVFDLTNTQITPPNYVTFTVGGLISGEDYVLVGPADGGALDTDQFGLQTSLTANNITSVVIDTSIPADTPSSGYIRVADNNGVFRRLHYSSYTGSTFTIDTTDGNEDFGTINATAGNDVFISYIDILASGASTSFTTVKSSGTRDLYIRVRDGGGTPIKTYEATSTLTTAPTQQTSAIRTSDS
jgi:hypothetical protein